MTREPREQRIWKRITVRLDESTATELEAELDRLEMAEAEFVRQAIRHAVGLASMFDRACLPRAAQSGGIDLDGSGMVDE